MATFNEYVQKETGMDVGTLKQQGMTSEMEAKLQESYQEALLAAK